MPSIGVSIPPSRTPSPEVRYIQGMPVAPLMGGFDTGILLNGTPGVVASRPVSHEQLERTQDQNAFLSATAEWETEQRALARSNGGTSLDFLEMRKQTRGSPKSYKKLPDAVPRLPLGQV
jgi:hypothetical protein